VVDRIGSDDVEPVAGGRDIVPRVVVNDLDAGILEQEVIFDSEILGGGRGD
jgi:hypothetical protein